MKQFLPPADYWENRLAACVTIHDNAISLYRWEGALQQETEAVLIAKTTKNQVQPATDLLKSLHKHALPCIIAWEVGKGYPPFLQWVANETIKA